MSVLDYFGLEELRNELKNSKKELSRFRALLRNAKTKTDTRYVQSEIDKLQAEIETLHKKVKSYHNKKLKQK